MSLSFGCCKRQRRKTYDEEDVCEQETGWALGSSGGGDGEVVDKELVRAFRRSREEEELVADQEDLVNKELVRPLGVVEEEEEPVNTDRAGPLGVLWEEEKEEEGEERLRRLCQQNKQW